MLEILKGHPISYALRGKTRVPEIYIQELWKSMTYHEDDGTPCIRGTINRVLLSVKPLWISHKGYEADSPFTAPSHFKKRRLAALWSTLFTPINRCMTWKKAGQDKCSIDTLTFFHGIAFDRHYDFAELIWKDLVSLVKDKDQGEFVPFIRFIKLVIANFMKTHPEITVRPYENYELLAYADPRAQVVNEYRLAYPSLVLAQPLKPTQEGRLDGEVRIECDGAGEPEAELATRALNMKGSSAGNEANEDNIPKGGGVNDTIGVEKKKRKREKQLKAKNDRDKRHSKKKSDGSPTESVSRASTSSANTPVLVDNIETDISRPLMHAPTPPIYLDTSLEVSISSRLGAKSHEPPQVPPSTVGIEKEDVLLHSSPSKSVGLDENDDVVRMYANIHEDNTDDGLQDLATTAALSENKNSDFRGLLYFTGHSNNNMETITTVIQQHSTTTTDSTPITMSFLMSQFQSLKEHIDMKGQPANSSDELPKDEYKKYSMDQLSSMLRSKILDETNKTDTQRSLLELLMDFVHDRFHPATQENVDALHDMFQTSIGKLTSQVEKLTRELNDLRLGSCWVLTPLTWIVLSRKASDHVMICMGVVFTVADLVEIEGIEVNSIICVLVNRCYIEMDLGFVKNARMLFDGVFDVVKISHANLQCEAVIVNNDHSEDIKINETVVEEDKKIEAEEPNP
uniref:Uncharacterized protein n=1 Tax=Tanacetum cinerariifolium TaxID=118510 RepID=A0A6L2MDE3_TANCI|nr:hypothetical protein [Tanacetum cinerariifolium]